MILYRIWADFATAQEPRRKVEAASGGGVPTEYKILESFVQWDGEAGVLVAQAIEAGVLALEPEPDGSGQALVAVGYEDANRKLASNMRSAGGFARAARLHAKSSRGEVDRAKAEHGDCPPPINVTPQVRDRANELGVNVWRALGLGREHRPPLEPDLPYQLFCDAVDVVGSRSGERIEKTLRWLISSRNSPDVPKRVDMILAEWDRFEALAKA